MSTPFESPRSLLAGLRHDVSLLRKSVALDTAGSATKNEPPQEEVLSRMERRIRTLEVALYGEEPPPPPPPPQQTPYVVGGCPWCKKEFWTGSHVLSDWEYCPHCRGSFSFSKPSLVRTAVTESERMEEIERSAAALGGQWP